MTSVGHRSIAALLTSTCLLPGLLLGSSLASCGDDATQGSGRGTDGTTSGTGEDPCTELACGEGTALRRLQDHAGSQYGATEGALAEVAAACTALAEVLGASVTPIEAEAPRERVVRVCGEAKLAYDQVAPGIPVTVAQPPCGEALSSQVPCEQGCTCDCTCGACPAPVCAGQVFGACAGECVGTCFPTEEARAISCSGRCTGICAGACSSGLDAEGRCEGTCDGSCEGACTPAPGTFAVCEGLCGGDCSVDYDDPQCDDWAPQEDPACEACANLCRLTWTGGEYSGGQPFCTAPIVDAPGLTEVVVVAIRQVAVACATAHRVSKGWAASRALAEELEAVAALGGDAAMCMIGLREVIDLAVPNVEAALEGCSLVDLGGG